MFLYMVYFFVIPALTLTLVYCIPAFSSYNKGRGLFPWYVENHTEMLNKTQWLGDGLPQELPRLVLCFEGNEIPDNVHEGCCRS